MIDQLYKELISHEIQYFEFLGELAKREKPKRILEIGSGWGMSSIAFLLNSPESVLTSVDKMPLSDLTLYKKRLDMFPDLWKRITMINGDSKNVLERMKVNEEKFDLIYIDGDHGYSGAKADFDNAGMLTLPGTIIVADDIAHYLNWITRDAKATNGEPEFGVARAAIEWAKEHGKQFTFHPEANGFFICKV